MINMDFTQRVIVDTASREWVASPKAGVWRKPLAREDAERGHATSVVRYEPGASFHSHNHPGGEEILVLEGTFSDETGDFGVGTYFRNPPGFVHAPFSREGCLILVKLHQFDDADLQRLSVKVDEGDWAEDGAGLQWLELHRYGSENVRLVKFEQGQELNLSQVADVEMFVVEGELQVSGAEELMQGAWLRSPKGDFLIAKQQTLLWLKTGHF
jgi:quercetin dioxygenase-like cupin family protein